MLDRARLMIRLAQQAVAGYPTCRTCVHVSAAHAGAHALAARPTAAQATQPVNMHLRASHRRAVRACASKDKLGACMLPPAAAPVRQRQHIQRIALRQKSGLVSHITIARTPPHPRPATLTAYDAMLLSCKAPSRTVRRGIKHARNPMTVPSHSVPGTARTSGLPPTSTHPHRHAAWPLEGGHPAPARARLQGRHLTNPLHDHRRPHAHRQADGLATQRHTNTRTYATCR